MVRICKNCGFENQDSYDFCAKCGTPLVEGLQPNTFFVYRTGADLNPFQYAIQYSDDNVTFSNLKSRYGYVQRDTVTYITITAIDNSLAVGASRYYRLALACSNAFNYSNLDDYLISFNKDINEIK